MYEFVSTETSVLITNILLLVIASLLFVIVGCALLLCIQFLIGACGCLANIVCKPTIILYRKFKYESLLNEQEDII
uniref:Envelope protein n=1 Tax=Eidolon bat coronavirus/Kenya/KY24/2006 TaxID=983924 RepID=F1DAZ3_9BETC|nr:envelope protein [Eidolon bat coronavirus/Kenya/KY24/2006]